MARISTLAASNVPVIITTSHAHSEDSHLAKKGTPRKRRPWLDYEEASLLNGLKLVVNSFCKEEPMNFTIVLCSMVKAIGLPCWLIPHFDLVIELVWI